MIGTFRKNKLNYELITVRGNKHYVMYCSSHPLHTFVEHGKHRGLKCFKAYRNFKTKPELVGYYVLDLENRNNRLFGTFKYKKLYLINKCKDLTWEEWIFINDKLNEIKYKEFKINN